MYDKVKQVFYSLVQAGLWKDKTPDLSLFPLSKGEWQEVLGEALHQTVEGVMYQGILKLPEQFLPPKEISVKWTVHIDRIAQRNRWMNKHINRQIAFFNQYGFAPYLLKGQGVARCYDIPLMRSSGDVDWAFENRADYQRLKRMVLEKGLELEDHSGYEASFMWNGCPVEFGWKMLDVHNFLNFKYARTLIKEEGASAHFVENEEAVWKLPSPLLTHVQVNLHILKHLLSFGIGLRQFCDAARVCYHYVGQVDGDKLESIYRRLGVLSWINLLHSALVEFLGLPEKYLPFPLRKADSSWMMEELWQTGNFATYDKRYDTKQEHTTGLRIDGKKRMIRNVLRYFPYAPAEAIGFPLFQLRTKFMRWKNMDS